MVDNQMFEHSQFNQWFHPHKLKFSVEVLKLDQSSQLKETENSSFALVTIKDMNKTVQKVFTITQNHDDVNANWAHWKTLASLNHVLTVVNASQKVHHSHANVPQVSVAKLVNWTHESVTLNSHVDNHQMFDANHSVWVLLFLTFASSKMVTLMVYLNNKSSQAHVPESMDHNN